MTKEEIKKIRKELGLTQVKFAQKLGVDTKTIQNWEAGKTIPQTKNGIIREILKSSTNPSAELITDTNQIISEEKQVLSYEEAKGKQGYLPLIPIEVMAGFPGIDNNGISLKDCDFYKVPEFIEKRADFLIRVSGASMYPVLENGDVIACRKINDLSFFQWGKIYVLDTEQGALVKYLYEDKDNPDNIICHSENTAKYPDFTLPKNAIRSTSIIVGAIKLF